MSDQAARLRELVRSGAPRAPEAAPGRVRRARVIAVTSGKGGVGKSHVAANLAVLLAQRGRRVIIFDADLGLANVDIICGITPKYTLAHVVSGRRDIFDVLADGPAGVKVVPGSSGIPYLANLGEGERERLLDDLGRLESEADVLIIDTGAGIAEGTTSFVSAADEIIVVTTPEATSITDAYAMVKVISGSGKHGRLSLVVNMAANRLEAERVSTRIREVAREFLGVRLHAGGYVVRDQHVPLALKRRVPLVLAYPSAQAGACMRALARSVASRLGGARAAGRPGFFSRIRSLFARSAV